MHEHNNEKIKKGMAYMSNNIWIKRLQIRYVIRSGLKETIQMGLSYHHRKSFLSHFRIDRQSHRHEKREVYSIVIFIDALLALRERKKAKGREEVGEDFGLALKLHRIYFLCRRGGKTTDSVSDGK